jgi:hypothetical protein
MCNIDDYEDLFTFNVFRNIPLKSYTGKVYSLLASDFRHVMMLDADSMPVQV